MLTAHHSRRNLGHPGTRLLAAAILTVWLTSPAEAQDTESQELQDVERALEQDRSRAEELARQAEALKREIRALRVESIAVADQAQSREGRLTEIESRLADLERQEATKRAQLRGRNHQLTGTLAALQRIALLPPDALLAAPGSPVETLRSAMLLRVAIPAIETRAATLRGELASIARLHQQIALQQHELATAAQDLESERGRLGALIERKRAARAAATNEQRAAQERAKKLAAQAKDLRDLLARLERESKARRERVAQEEEARLARAAAARQAQEQAAREARELAERQARERAALETKARAERQAREDAERATQELAERQARERAEAQAQALAQRQAREEAERAAQAREVTTQLALARPDNVRPFPDSGASLRMPARGRVVRHYGQSAGTEGAAKGINIEARGGAQVVAPYDGQVVYAGPFRRYGQILIIEHGGRYHTLLAGLDRIDAVVGQWLLAGEPVGILSSPQDGNPELYFELRRAGQPINPLPWLATTGDKVRG
jgi:septal ring factor EnvC (AmiA/AmiB activator)